MLVSMWAACISSVFKEYVSCTLSREQLESREWWTRRDCEYFINVQTSPTKCVISYHHFTILHLCAFRSRLVPEHHSRVEKTVEAETTEEKTVKEESSGESFETLGFVSVAAEGLAEITLQLYVS